MPIGVEMKLKLASIYHLASGEFRADLVESRPSVYAVFMLPVLAVCAQCVPITFRGYRILGKACLESVESL